MMELLQLAAKHLPKIDNLEGSVHDFDRLQQMARAKSRKREQAREKKKVMNNMTNSIQAHLRRVVRVPNYHPVNRSSRIPKSAFYPPNRFNTPFPTSSYASSPCSLSQPYSFQGQPAPFYIPFRPNMKRRERPSRSANVEYGSMSKTRKVPTFRKMSKTVVRELPKSLASFEKKRDKFIQYLVQLQNELARLELPVEESVRSFPSSQGTKKLKVRSRLYNTSSSHLKTKKRKTLVKKDKKDRLEKSEYRRKPDSRASHEKLSKNKTAIPKPDSRSTDWSRTEPVNIPSSIF